MSNPVRILQRGDGGGDKRSNTLSLQNIFNAAVSTPQATNNSTARAAGNHAVITPPAASDNQATIRLLNDHLNISNKNNVAAGGGKNQPQQQQQQQQKKIKIKLKSYESPICADDAQVCGSRGTVGKPCMLCKSKDPLMKQSFIDHIMGKKHRIADYKRKQTKQQKVDRDCRTLHVTGFDARTLPEEICGIFWLHGMIDIYMTKKHVFVEFSTKVEAMTALTHKFQTVTGRRLNIAVRTPRHHVDDKIVEDPVEFFLSPVIKNLITILPHNQQQLHENVERLLNDIQLRPQEYENRQYVRGRIEDFLRLEFPNVACHIFGSSGNNLGFRGADIDLYAALGYDPYDTPRAADGEAAAAKLTYYLAKHLRRQHWIVNVEAIPKARVPIIKFQQSGVAVDLSFRNGMPIQNTALIRLYTYVHPLVRPYMMVVRFWAKMQRIAGGGRPDTLLTNYALTMLMAFVIMTGERKMLPSLSQLRRQSYRTVVINGWNCGFGENTEEYSRKKHDCSILQLVLEFFQYYGSLDASEWVICPLIGDLVSRTDMASKSLSKVPQDLQDYVKAPGNLQHETPLCIQDPFDLSHNVSRGLKKIPLERFQLLCRKSSELTEKIMRFEAPLAELFQPVEITDDMYEPDNSLTTADPSREANVHDVTEDEVITLDDDDELDTSQDVAILEEVRNVIQLHEDKISGNNHFQLDKGTKRSSSESHGSSDNCVVMSDKPDETMTTTTASLTSTEVSVCSTVQPNDPHVYKINVPLDIAYQLNKENGELTHSAQAHTIDSVKDLCLDIFEFMFNRVYLADVDRVNIEGQGASKRLKNDSSENPYNCYAKLDVTVKHNLRKSIVKLRQSHAQFDSVEVSPFTLENKMARLQANNIDTDGLGMSVRKISPVKLHFLLCHSAAAKSEVLLVANTFGATVNEKAFLTAFLRHFTEVTDKCMKKAVLHMKYLRRSAQQNK